MDDSTYFSNESATFGDRVAAAREVLGLSQSDLSKKLGVKLKTIRGWEDDVSEPRANKLQMLSGVLNVSMRWLLMGEGDDLEAPNEEAPVPAEVTDILIEMRRTRAEFARLAVHLGHLEKRLSKILKEPS